MIDEVQIIRPDGIPVYHYTKGETFNDSSLLEASFFTALNSFGNELGNGEIRKIIFSGKSYLVKSTDNYILTFASDDLESLNPYERLIEEACTRLDSYISSNEDRWRRTYILEERSVEVFDQFNALFHEINIVPEEEEMDFSSFRDRVNRFIFDSVGYRPGSCNIGKEGVYSRYLKGALALIVSLATVLIIAILDLSPIYRLLTIVPNTFAAFAFLQAKNRFCVVNALDGQVDMK